MTTIHSAWFQPDPVDTRERMRVKINLAALPINYTKLEHQGVIDYDGEYRPQVAIPTYTSAWQATTYTDDETAYSYSSMAWLSTLGLIEPGIGRSYEAALMSVGSGTHLQDPWVGDLLAAMNADIIAQVIAGTHPGVPAGLMSFSVVFEDDGDGYPGTVAGREVEISSAGLTGAFFNRGGDILGSGPGAGAFDAIWGIAIPLSASNPSGDDISDEGDAGDYATIFGVPGYTGPSGTPPDAWSSPVLEARATAVPFSSNVADGIEVLGTVEVGGATETWAVDDAWWEANKWTITRFGPDVNYGIPLALSPQWLIEPALNGSDIVPPYGAETHTAGTASATIYMNAVWTPPRYQIIYDIDYVPVTRQQSRDDGRGLSAAPRLVPAPKSARLVGGHQ